VSEPDSNLDHSAQPGPTQLRQNQLGQLNWVDSGSQFISVQR